MSARSIPFRLDVRVSSSFISEKYFVKSTLRISNGILHYFTQISTKSTKLSLKIIPSLGRKLDPSLGRNHFSGNLNVAVMDCLKGRS